MRNKLAMAFVLICVGIMLIVILARCHSAGAEIIPTPIPTATATVADTEPPHTIPTATATQAATAVPTATVTSTPAPTDTPEPTATAQPTATVTATTEATTAPVYGEHRIVAGDTYWEVAEVWYRNPYCWPGIQAASHYDRFLLPIGGTLYVPEECGR